MSEEESSASSSKERSSVARENEENEEEREESPSSDDHVPLISRNPIERMQSLQFSLRSAFDEYDEYFYDIVAELSRAKSENKELVERNNKLAEELKRAKEGEESSKRNLEQTRNKLRELCTTFAAVKEECDQACSQQDYRGGVLQLPKKRKYVLKVYEVNDFLNCQICLEPWTRSGSHVICSLSCGHFFGRSCIRQWILRDESRGSSTCPVCMSRATLSDVRPHFLPQIYDEEVKHEQED